MNNLIENEKNKNISKYSRSKKYALIVLCLSIIPFLVSLYFLIFGHKGSFLADRDLGGTGALLLGPAILFILLALKIEKKYSIGAILLTTLALILIFSGLVIIFLIFN